MERDSRHEEDRREPEQEADAQSAVTTHVTDQVERARTEVFRAYVRSRERARQLGETDPAEQDEQ